MIVIDASMVGPIVFLDEAPLPATLAGALASHPIVAPAHWSLEVTNMLVTALRRGRIDPPELSSSFDLVSALRVEVSPAPDMATCQAVAALAEQQRLTVYDAAYLHLALVRSATIATLDGALARAAIGRGVEVLTFP